MQAGDVHSTYANVEKLLEIVIKEKRKPKKIRIKRFFIFNNTFFAKKLCSLQNSRIKIVKEYLHDF